MSERHLVAILTAIVRKQDPDLDGGVAVMQAIALARGGMGAAELAEAIVTVLGWNNGLLLEILPDVDFALGLRAVLGAPTV